MEQVAPRQEWSQAALVLEKSIMSFVSWGLPPAVTLNVLLKLLATVSALLCLHLVELAQVSVQTCRICEIAFCTNLSNINGYISIRAETASIVKLT